MNRIVDEIVAQGVKKRAIEIATTMKKTGSFPDEIIAEMTSLPLDTVKAIKPNDDILGDSINRIAGLPVPRQTAWEELHDQAKAVEAYVAEATAKATAKATAEATEWHFLKQLKRYHALGKTRAEMVELSGRPEEDVVAGLRRLGLPD